MHHAVQDIYRASCLTIENILNNNTFLLSVTTLQIVTQFLYDNCFEKMQISLPTEGITKTVLIGFGATLADVRQKLMSKLQASKIPSDISNWAFLLTKDIDQMWLDDKVSLKAYNVKDGVSAFFIFSYCCLVTCHNLFLQDTLEFKRKVKLLGKISTSIFCNLLQNEFYFNCFQLSNYFDN